MASELEVAARRVLECAKAYAVAWSAPEWKHRDQKNVPPALFLAAAGEPAADGEPRDEVKR